VRKNKPDAQTVVIYTDGACHPNPGRGGWGAILFLTEGEKIIRGSAAQTTNNRMELTAAIEALKLVPENLRVVVYTDSQYLKQGIEEWLPQWKNRNWRRKGGKLANLDLWKELSIEQDRLNIKWNWVRGHSGDRNNERVNRIAQNAMYG